MRRLWSLLVLSSIFASLAATAQAAPVLVGSPLTGTFSSSNCSGPCTLLPYERAGASETSPVTGAIIGWHIIGGSSSYHYRLRVASVLTSGTLYVASGTSAPATHVGAGIETFPAALPIVAGQQIGIDLEGGAPIGLRGDAGAGYASVEPPLAEGVGTATTEGGGLELGFNAEVQPAPTITVFAATAGPTGGGTSVLINGTDLEGTTSVKFGSVPAPFTQSSESAITAVTPASASAGSVPITLTTIAGTTTSTQQFTYQDPVTSTPGQSSPPASSPISAPAKLCTVPKLKGKSLKVSKSKIKGADCQVGGVTKKKGAKAATGKVVGQSKKPGTVLAAGTVVNVTLGKG
jgi:hypothetical protein